MAARVYSPWVKWKVGEADRSPPCTISMDECSTSIFMVEKESKHEDSAKQVQSKAML
jgi:hypothetical protein